MRDKPKDYYSVAGRKAYAKEIAAKVKALTPAQVDVPEYGCKIVGLRRDKYRSNGALVVLAATEYPDGQKESVTVSINLDHADNKHMSRALKSNEFFCKNYSEGESIYKALVTAGWIVPTGFSQHTGFVTCPACTINESVAVLTDALSFGH